MSLTNAMLTGFTGIKSNGTAVDTVGDNLANLNTTAFKGQRTLFETLLYRTISEGEGPSADTGGTLPRQVGSGATVGAIQRNFRQGELEATGFQSDLAIEGDGFFIINRPNGDQAFTRDGAFHLDANQRLVNNNEAAVQVFPADESGVINTGALSDLIIPLGSASQAIATSRVVMDGRLNASSSVASDGAIVASTPLRTSSGSPANSSTPLTDLVNDQGIPLFAAGDVLQLNARRGTLSVPGSTFQIGANGSTLGELAQHMTDWLAIDTTVGGAGSAGVFVSDGIGAPAGSLVVRSNAGQINAITLDAGSIVNTTGVIASPFAFSQVTEATGEGITTSFGVYDSLGTPLEVRLRMSLESASESGTTWRFFAESPNDSDPSPLLGTGTVSFDTNGQFVSATGTDLSIHRAGSGAVSPLSFTMDFSQLTGLASPDGGSVLIMDTQDGAPPGVLIGYTIGRDGVVTGTYSNQRSQVLGQMALATFTNNEGLVALSENTFVAGPNSGNPDIMAPQTGIAGSIVSGALEAGNVEIAREFINLISASTGISAASRVVRSADEMLQELLELA